MAPGDTTGEGGKGGGGERGRGRTRESLLGFKVLKLGFRGSPWAEDRPGLRPPGTPQVRRGGG